MSDKSVRFYNPLFHVPAQIIFRITLFIVMFYNIFISRINIMGRENLIIPQHGSFLISNHSLYLDPAIIAHVIAPRRTFFTALEQTFRIFFIGTYIRYLGAFPISKTTPLHILASNIEYIFRRKNFIHFFPEGELTHLNTSINVFKNGVFFLAFRFNRPIIPITVITKPRRCLNKTLNNFFCRVTVKIGEPVYPSQFKKKAKTIKQQMRLMADYCREKMLSDITIVHGCKVLNRL